MSSMDMEQLRREFEAALAEVQAVTESLRADGAALLDEFAQEREELRRARERAMPEVAEEALRGEQGRARQELQRRIDLGETTWRHMLSGADQHWSAVEVRDEIVGDVRATVDELEREDPEFSAEYRRNATLRRGEPGEWP